MKKKKKAYRKTNELNKKNEYGIGKRKKKNLYSLMSEFMSDSIGYLQSCILVQIAGS